MFFVGTMMLNQLRSVLIEAGMRAEFASAM